MAAREKIISYHALHKARTTVEDFVQSYFPLHGLQVPQDFFKVWDVLVFVEAAIYEMDEENEALALAGNAAPEVTFKGERIILEVLREKGLLNYHIQLQLLQGKLYWQRERSLSARLALASPANLPCHVPQFTVDEAHAVSEAKSFDYRLLNHLLYNIQKREPDKQLLEFLFLDEHLVDIADDLHDYEDDVAANTFNVFRAYIHLFGTGAELELVKRISEFELRHKAALEKLPHWVQEAYSRRQKQASAVPGSEKWVFPRPIFDERSFREQGFPREVTMPINPCQQI